MATEEQVREKELEFLGAQHALAAARAWTPNTKEVAELVISRINDKYAGVKPDVEESVELVFAVLKSVQKRLIQPGLWAQTPTAAPLADGAVR